MSFDILENKLSSKFNCGISYLLFVRNISCCMPATNKQIKLIHIFNLLLHKSLPVALYALKIPQLSSRNEMNLLLFDKNLH